MDIKILIDFVEKFRGKDIDKKFNHLKAYKKIYMSNVLQETLNS